MPKAGEFKQPKTGVKLPGTKAQSLSQKTQERRAKIEQALSAKGYFQKPKAGEYLPQYIEDVYDGTVVFATKDGLFAANYKVSGEQISVGEKQAVESRRIYVPKQ